MFFAISKLKAHCSDYIIKDMATRQIYQDSSDEEVQLRFANLVDFHSPDITFDPNLKWFFKYFFKQFFKRFFSQLNWHPVRSVNYDGYLCVRVNLSRCHLVAITVHLYWLCPVSKPYEFGPLIGLLD